MAYELDDDFIRGGKVRQYEGTRYDDVDYNTAMLGGSGAIAGELALIAKMSGSKAARDVAFGAKVYDASKLGIREQRKIIADIIARNGGSSGNIPIGSPDWAEFVDASQLEELHKQNSVRAGKIAGRSRTLNKVLNGDLLGGAGSKIGAKVASIPLIGKASSAMSKMGPKGKMIAAGLMATGAGMAGSAAVTDSDDEMRQKVYNKLRYGHYETDEQLRKRRTLTETGNIGESGLSEEEFENYWQKNKEAFGREYGGYGNAVNIGSQILAGVANPFAGLLGSVGADGAINSVEDKFNMSMADSLASQAQGRRVRYNADTLYGDKFAAGLLGEYLPLENMMGVDNNVRQVTKPYVDPATAAAQQKAKMAYDADSDKDMWGTAFRPNAARDGGQRWFQDVNELVSSGRDTPEDNELRRDALRGIMHAQGLITDREFYAGMPKGAINTAGATPAGATPAGAVTPQAATPAGVIQNAQSNLSDVRNPMSQNINVPPPTNPQDAENLMRTRAIMSGEANVAGAIGQSQAAYMNSRGMLTAKQQDNAVSDWRKSYWESRGLKGFNYTPPPKPAQPVQPASPTVGPSTLPSERRVVNTPLGPFGGSSVPQSQNDPYGSSVPLSPIPPIPDRKPVNYMRPATPTPSPFRPTSTPPDYRFRAGTTPY